MRVLVTGATTPVGAALVDRLTGDPAVDRVVAVGLEEADDLPASLRHPAVSWHRADLTRHRNLRHLLAGPVADAGVDSVIHLALHRSAADRGRRIRRLNVDATRLLLRLAEDHPTITRFVFASSAAVYRLRAETPTVLREDAELALGGGAQWLRDRVEADVGVCTRMGLSDLSVAVLRLAEVLAPDAGSQLLDYLGARVCLRPLGYDPMLNLLSVDDAARALHLALQLGANGVFNVPGGDTLPLSRAIECCGRRQVPVPGPLVGWLYGARGHRGGEFRYDLNADRFHHTALLDGARAEAELSYRPEQRIDWSSLLPS